MYMYGGGPAQFSSPYASWVVQSGFSRQGDTPGRMRQGGAIGKNKERTGNKRQRGALPRTARSWKLRCNAKTSGAPWTEGGDAASHFNAGAYAVGQCDSDRECESESE